MFIYGAMREFTLGPLGESRSAPGGRQLLGQAANLTFESAPRAGGKRATTRPLRHTQSMLIHNYAVRCR